MLTKYTDEDVINAYKFFGFNKIVTHKKIRDVFEELANKHHPDNGGDEEKMSEINYHHDAIKNFFKSHKKLSKNTRLNKEFHEIFDNIEIPVIEDEAIEEATINEDAESEEIALSEENRDKIDWFDSDQYKVSEISQIIIRCEKCGVELPDESVFCYKCGAKI